MSNLEEKREIDTILLALLRTELSNRRTLLAYIKTALGVAVTGFGLLKWTEAGSIYAIIGLACIPLSFVILIGGIADFMFTRTKIEDEKKDAGV